MQSIVGVCLGVDIDVRRRCNSVHATSRHPVCIHDHGRDVCVPVPAAAAAAVSN